ncbi:Plant peroxidase [Corchorus olitorius]|uniref:Peroxidase n=1 Tax=Corchorus olitorius TaxID=93759 RepID=A0A1R3HQI9_9ROSI|nr:Plant peroxidase [Corchorus olitorius]
MAGRIPLFFLASRVAMVMTLLVLSSACQAQLSPTFYDKTCPKALTTIRTAVRAAVDKERNIAASLLRLQFHDCFVQGCDASVLLDDSDTFKSEKSAPQNSLAGLEVVDQIKSAVENVCPGVVSCADLLAVVARDASEYVNGPTWTVKLGRRDSTTASLSLATSDLPRFDENFDKVITMFANKGFNVRELVALSGAHSIGQAACFTFRDWIYSNQNILELSFVSKLRLICPPLTGNNGTFVKFDPVTPDTFDNGYYKNLMQKKGLLKTDQLLFSNGGSTAKIVEEYSKDPSKFKSDFAAAIVKMGDIQPLTGSAGIIRKNCRRVDKSDLISAKIVI